MRQEVADIDAAILQMACSDDFAYTNQAKANTLRRLRHRRAVLYRCLDDAARQEI